MLGVVIQIEAWDPIAGARAPLLAGSHDVPDVCHLDSQTWWPVIARLPKLGYDLFDGAFEGQIATPSATMSIGVEPWSHFGRLSLADARIRLWTGSVGSPWAAWTQRVDARVTQQPVVADGRAELTFAVDDRWLDRALLDTYAGTTGAEGPAALKGQAKPLALGAPRYVPGVLVDAANSIFQISGYGAIVAVEAALERLVRYGPPAGDYPSFAALQAANIPAGRWATSLVGGWARFGAPTTGQVSFLVSGDVAGPDGWARRPGHLIRRLALLSGGAGRIADASLNALSAARPYDLSLYLDQQTTARDLIQQLAASVNAVAGVSWMGRLFVLPVAIGAATMTLAADGSALPPVAKVRQLEISAPFGKLAMTAERAWTVHQLSDIAFTATLVDVGDYAAGTTYREGNIVQYQGSTWLYINPAASAGNAPPTLPTDSDSFWRVLARAGGKGEKGESAPLVRTQWSIDGLTNWHDNFFGADRYARQSNDNGATWGPAELRIGEAGAAGVDGKYTSTVHLRSSTVPATPANNAGDPPPGWSDGPYGTTADGFLFESKADFRNGAQLTGWTAPVRSTGPTGANGAGTFTLNGNGVVVTPNSARRVDGAGWNAGAVSNEGWRGGAQLSFRLLGGSTAAAGLGRNPLADNNFVSIDYAWIGDGDGTLLIRELGDFKSTHGAFNDATRLQIKYDNKAIVYFKDGVAVRTIDAPADMLLYFDSSINVGAIVDISFGGMGGAGADGLSAPLVRTQWSIDGLTNWHDNFFGADRYARQSNDNGATWGPAELRIGEAGAAGVDGKYTSTVHLRSSTIPATPASNSGDPPPGWSDGPYGTTADGFLFESKADFRNGAQLTGWTAPVRSTGEKGEKGNDSTVPGPAGVPALNLTASVSSLSFAADYLGNLKSGQLAQVIVFTYTEGPTNVSTSVDWTTPEFSGCAGSMTSAGLVTFTSVTASGYVRVTGTYKGTSFTSKVPITLAKDAPPANSDEQVSTGVGRTISSNSYPASPDATVVASIPSGTLRGQFNISYSPDGRGNVYLEAMLAYRRAGTSDAWNYLPAVQGSQGRIGGTTAEPIDERGIASADQTASVAAGRWEVGLFVRRYQGNLSGTYDGGLKGGNG